MTKQQDLAAKAEAEQAEAEKAAAPKGKQVKARVLMACIYGEADDLVEIGELEAKQAQAAGQVDTHKDAVAYAAKLPQNAQA